MGKFQNIISNHHVDRHYFLVQQHHCPSSFGQVHAKFQSNQTTSRVCNSAYLDMLSKGVEASRLVDHLMNGLNLFKCVPLWNNMHLLLHESGDELLHLGGVAHLGRCVACGTKCKQALIYTCIIHNFYA